jgi:hypothetical protein
MEKNQNAAKFALCKKIQIGLYQIIEIIDQTSSKLKDYDIGYRIAPLTKASATKVDKYLKLDKAVLITEFRGLTKLEPYDIVVKDSLPEIHVDVLLEQAKQNILLEAERFFDQKINTVANLTYYEFIVLNNSLMEQGYFITDANKEEKYIEILEKENDELIDLLEKYLMNKDEISRAFAAYDNYCKLKNEIRDADTLEESTEIYNRFKKDWISKAGYVSI